VQLGLSGSTAIAPTAWIKYNANHGFYNQFGAQRSISPVGPAIYTDHQGNQAELKLRTEGTRTLYIDEVGFKQVAVGDKHYTWLRAGVIYNNTEYRNYKTGGTSENSGAYALADRQLIQFDKDGGRRGLYAGVSAMYAKPETNTITQYYEARLYSFGPFAARPRDMLSIVYQHNVISDYFQRYVRATSATTRVYPNDALNSLTASYEFKIVPGFSVTTGLGYTDKPTATRYHNEGSSLNVLLGMFIAI
jgi:porin